MEPWNHNDTYGLVRNAFGQKQERLVRSSTQSVLDRQAFARYHFREVLRLSNTFERQHLKSCSMIHTYDGGPKREAFENYIIKIGAHATAAVQSIHAIPDILAHAIYFACGLNLGENKIEEHKIALPAVIGALKKDSTFKRICPLLINALMESHGSHIQLEQASQCNSSPTERGLDGQTKEIQRIAILVI